MNAQQLRNSILQEAIEGRLVPQDPNDEPASVLLNRIREEKKRLVKEGKLKKKDLEETPISEDEKPFEIPKGWEWVRFGAITINRDSERIPLSVDERRMLMKTYDYYGASGVIDKVDRYLFDKPLLLIGEDGANLINRSTPIAFIARGKYWVNNHAHVLDYYNEELMQYMCMYINAISLVDYVTGTAQPKMNQEKMNSIMVALPPLAEQKRIVAKIEELLPKVEEYGKAQEALNKLNKELPERLKKSILQEAITGRLVPQDPNDEPASVLLDKIRAEKKQLVKEGKLKKKDLEETPISEDEKPFEIPESWEWCRVCDITDSYIGLTYKPTDVSTNGWVVLRSSNIQDGLLDYNDIVRVNMDIPEKLRVQVNDIIICARNGSKKLVGKSALVREVNEPTTFGAFMAICRTQFYEYMAKYLLSPLFFQQLRKDSDTTTINQLTQKTFNRYLVPLPPLAEQKRIVAKIEELFGVLDSIKESLEV